jgi:hypothetical protein
MARRKCLYCKELPEHRAFVYCITEYLLLNILSFDPGNV